MRGRTSSTVIYGDYIIIPRNAQPNRSSEPEYYQFKTINVGHQLLKYNKSTKTIKDYGYSETTDEDINKWLFLIGDISSNININNRGTATTTSNRPYFNTDTGNLFLEFPYGSNFPWVVSSNPIQRFVDNPTSYSDVSLNKGTYAYYRYTVRARFTNNASYCRILDISDNAFGKKHFPSHGVGGLPQSAPTPTAHIMRRQYII